MASEDISAGLQTLEHMHSESSTVVSLRFKELDDHFNLTHNSILERQAELEVKEKLNEEHKKEIELKEQCLTELEELNEQLSERAEIREKKLEVEKEEFKILKQSLEQRVREVESRERELDSLKRTLEEQMSKAKCTEERYDSLVRSVEEGYKEVESKQMDNEDKSKMLEWRRSYLIQREKKHEKVVVLFDKWFGELISKMKQSGLFQDLVDDCITKEEGEVGNIELIQTSFDKLLEELESKEKQLSSIQKLNEERSHVLDCREKELSLIQNRMSETQKEMKSKEDHLKSLETSIGDRSDKLEGVLKLLKESSEEFEKERKLKMGQIEFAQRRIQACVKEVEEKEKHLESIQIHSGKKMCAEVEHEQNLNKHACLSNEHVSPTVENHPFGLSSSMDRTAPNPYGGSFGLDTGHTSVARGGSYERPRSGFPDKLV